MVDAGSAQVVAEACRPSFGSPPLQQRLDAMSLDGLRESILRRVMRLACGVGLAGMLLSLSTPKPTHLPALFSGIVALIAVFGATYVPLRVPVLTLVYPTALVALGVALVEFLGLRIDAFLVLSGGMFVGSLVLGTRALTALGVLGGLGTIAAVWHSHKPVSVEEEEVWRSAIASLVAIVVPTMIAGRLLVGALDRALKERQRLVDEVMAERETLQKTIHDLETTRTQLTHAQKLELMSQLAGGIAHDMNNALTAIIGEASLLDDQVADERERILEAGEYAAKLTHQLMVFARRDTSQPKPIDVVAAIASLLRAVRRVIPSDIALELELSDTPLVVVADGTQLLQVLLNLATNAKDAMPSGGVLGVSLTADASGSRAVLRVSDTGTGINPEHLPRIFDPFFTTKPAGRGTGLGLPNVKHLVTSMNGSIDVETHLGKGTTFEVYLPLVQGELARDHEPTSQRPRKTGTILVVDDDVRVRAVAYTALQKVGHRVFEASSVPAALELARARGRGVDLLLTDVVMEGGGGAEVIRLVRQAVPSIRVLVMSGYADDETLRRGIAQGEFPFIAKPFTSETLTVAVDRVLNA